MAISNSNIATFEAQYGAAQTWDQLFWAHAAQTPFLGDISALRKGGRALDIGCGAGTDSIFLAAQGWDVTSLDFVPKALEFTETRAKQAGVSVTPVVADILEWDPCEQFDLVLDHGLLHNMHPDNHALYREQVLKLMSDGADFVLLHWLKNHPQQPVTSVGPNRRSREELKGFFAPDLREKYFAVEEIEDLPIFTGGTLSQATFWFQRNQSFHQPDGLIDQIKATLKKKEVDFDAMIAEAGEGLVSAALPTNLLARVVGPGRLGMELSVPMREEGPRIIHDWAKRAGHDGHMTENLLRIFAAKEHGGLCNDVPQCKECDVMFCKNKRER